ncbi:Hypothetical_protein [Hexamita inflata]|uniref:Hypothetical_protein n=1 Tax=Hexamita inflata TaxID=28002 RepID=A0AA86UPG1_9EUKA|nr:Hypothetical protein HINF_LOCUS54165 [Hexamita inflata]
MILNLSSPCNKVLDAITSQLLIFDQLVLNQVQLAEASKQAPRTINGELTLILIYYILESTNVIYDLYKLPIIPAENPNTLVEDALIFVNFREIEITNILVFSTHAIIPAAITCF